MTSELFKQRKNKFLREMHHLQRLEEKGFHNLEIADRLIHGLIDLMQQGVRNQHPGASEKQINQILKEEIKATLELKKKWRKKKGVRI
ncbi:MAG: hypothetical protein ACTSRW_05895 [Candidatus Helarchaeota archaeon]